MDAIAADAPARYTRTMRRNCSMSPRARLLFLGSLMFNVMLVATLAAWAGAWPVLPFAGLEIIGVAIAFRLVATHDGDFERLSIDGERIVLVVCKRGAVSQTEFNRAWATLVCRTSWR